MDPSLKPCSELRVVAGNDEPGNHSTATNNWLAEGIQKPPHINNNTTNVTKPGGKVKKVMTVAKIMHVGEAHRENKKVL